MRPGIFQGQKGSILILTLSILVLLSIFTAAVGRTVHQRLKKIERLEDRAELRSIAESGVKKVRYILKRDEQKGGPDFLSDNWSQSDLEFLDIPVGQGSFTILGDKFNATQNMIEGREESTVHGAVDEERKININKTSSPEILTRLFQAAGGISYEEANQIALSLLDWRDADDNPYDQGAESAYYRRLTPPYVPKNADFGTLEELLLVKGMTNEIYDKVLPYITLYSDGLININTASWVILKALGFSDSLARKILLLRTGPDGRAGTSDDRVFKDFIQLADNITRFYGLNDVERGSLESFTGSGILSIASKYFSVRSIARFPEPNNSRLTIECVVTRDGIVRSWQEYYSMAS